ncbi:transcription factor E4F1-like [Liolophura sinensis]|uniref:transcription factor E4F1-like n=1 Tax=Liolophura sinensis TaxID=3198878 RepID=UPI0031588531
MSSESDKPSAVRVHIVVAGEEEGTTYDDVHYCGKCKLVFSNIKDYLEHKVSHDSCQVTYSRSAKDRRMFVPNVVPKKNIKTNQDAAATQTSQEKKPVQKRVSSQQKAVDESLITQKFTYSCSVCTKEFNRVAALKRHLEYDHKLRQDSDPFKESAHTSGTDEEHEGAAEEDREEDDQPVQKKPRTRRTTGLGDKPHICEICGNKFKEASVLKTHMLIHTNERLFPCTVDGCSYSFKTKGSLTRHLRRHTGEKPYSCNLCGRSFSESGALTRHLKSRTPCRNKSDTDLPRYGKRWGFEHPAPIDEKAPGSVQGPSVNLQVTAERGEEEKGGKGAEEADVEDSQGEKEGASVNPEINTKRDSVELGEEVIDASEEKTILTMPVQLPENACRVCRLSCGSVEDLKSHLRLHLADTSFRCELCHYVADSQDQLLHHKQNIHVQKTHQGPVVTIAQVPNDSTAATSEKTLSRDAKLAVQQLLEVQGYGSDVSSVSMSQGEKAVYTCPICQKSLRGQSYINQHMKTHTGERPFKCMQCEKTFTCRDTLTKHVAVHTEERQYKCGECGKLFKRISHVREHLKSHSGERPFQCNVCEKTFKTSNAAKVHSRTHSDVLPYECLQCHKFFREKGSLQRHVRMHTGEKPFKCKHCGRAFAEHGTLGRHLKAKVPCTYFPQGENKSQEGYPTVLAEFSSVVADTQQYIMPDTLPVSTASQDSHGQLSTELVVVQASEIPVDQIQNVEIIASGAGEETMVLNSAEDLEEGSQYVVLGEPGDDLRVLDPHTGQTVATVPAHMVSMAQEEGDIEALIMNPDNDVEGVVMNSDHQYPQEFQLGVMHSSSQAIHDSQVQTVRIIDAGSGVRTVRINEDGSAVETVRINEDGSDVQTVRINKDSNGVQNVRIMQAEDGVHTVRISEDGNVVQTVNMSEVGSSAQVETMSEISGNVEAVTMSQDSDVVSQEEACVETIIMMTEEQMEVTDSINQVILQDKRLGENNTQGQPSGLGKSTTAGDPLTGTEST